MNRQVELNAGWQAMLQQPHEQWDLCHAALLIASQLQPELDISASEQQLSSMAETVRARVNGEMSVNDRIQQINSSFYTDLGFAGDNQDYYLADNSLLNLVLERRLGIPITLSVIYLRLADAAGIDAYGIAFPGHYLVGVHADNRELVLDAFDNGRLLEQKQLHRMLQQFTAESSQTLSLEQSLQPATHSDTVVRMLRNLKQIYIDGQEVELALTCIEMILSIIPDAPDELRDRGMIYQHIEYTQGAINDLTHYLKLVPDAEERGVIEALLDSLQTQHQSLH